MEENNKFDLIKHLKIKEGFRGYQYNDHLGNPTIGYGTLLPLTTDEAELILKHRLEIMRTNLYDATDGRIEELPPRIQKVLLAMAYQLGVYGLMQFKRMWAAIYEHDWQTAYKEALDSRWARQTPKRARQIAYMILEGK